MSIYDDWKTTEPDDIFAPDIREAHCAECGEADVAEALVTVYVATPEWHRCTVEVHPECRELFVRANLPAVLASLRGARL